MIFAKICFQAVFVLPFIKKTLQTRKKCHLFQKKSDSAYLLNNLLNPNGHLCGLTNVRSVASRFLSGQTGSDDIDRHYRLSMPVAK